MANLYGRVGVDNYEPEELSAIVETLAPHVMKAVQNELGGNFLNVGSKATLGKITGCIQIINNPSSKPESLEKAAKDLATILESLSAKT